MNLPPVNLPPVNLTQSAHSPRTRPTLRVRRMLKSTSRAMLLGLAMTLLACSTQDERGVDAGLGDAGEVMVPSDEPDAGMTQSPYPECTLADAQKPLDGPWARTDRKGVWSEEQLAQCRAKCGNHPAPIQCAQDNCAGGMSTSLARLDGGTIAPRNPSRAARRSTAPWAAASLRTA